MTKTSLRPLLITLFATVLSTGAWAGSDSRGGFLEFQGGASYVTQAGGGSSNGGELSWTPQLLEGSFLGLRGDAGAEILNAGLGGDFLAFHGCGYLQVFLLSFLTIEAGGGYEYWNGNGGGALTYGGGLAVPLGYWLGFINRIYLGYSQFALPNNATQEFHAGLGFLL